MVFSIPSVSRIIVPCLDCGERGIELKVSYDPKGDVLYISFGDALSEIGDDRGLGT